MPLAESDRKQSPVWAALAGYSLLPAIGLACFRLPPWAMFRSDISYLGDNIAFISHLIQNVAIILFLIIDYRTSYSEKQLLRLLSIGTLFVLAGSVVFVFAPSGMLYAYIGCAISGAASTVPLLIWGYYFCSVNPRKSAFELTLAFALYGVTTRVFAAMPSYWTSVLMVIGPLISYICLRMSILRNNAHIPAERHLSMKTLSTVPWGLFLVLFICMVSNVLAKVLVPTDEALLSSSSYQFFWPTIFIAIFAIYCIWIFVLKRDDIERLWPIFVLVIFSGLLCYSSFSSTQPSFAQSFLRATQECLMLFCWVVAAGLAYTHKLPRIALFGLMTLAFVKPPTVASAVLFLRIPTDTSTQAGSAAVVVAAAMAFLLVVVALSFTGFTSWRSKKTLPSLSPQTSPTLASIPEGVQERVVEGLKEGYSLTQRETEVALYLAKGYTMQQTADLLCVSLDTIRAHSKGLYRKTGIHKKQDLIALVEHECKDAGLRNSK